MMNVGLIKQAIREELSKYCPRVFNERSLSEELFKDMHIVFYFTLISRHDNIANVRLRVDCFDYGEDSRKVEDLADSICEGLEKWQYLNQGMFLRVYFASRDSIEEDNKSIIHRRINFDGILCA